MSRPGPPRSGGSSRRAEQVEPLAVTEIAEQQHADMVVADRPRRRPDPAREVKAHHPGAGADAALRDLLPESREGAVDVIGHHLARVGAPAVVALADHREHDLVRAAPRCPDRGVVDDPDRVRAAQVHRGLDRPALVDLDPPGQLAHPVDAAVPARAGSDGGATTVTPVGSPLAACEWPTSTPGDVGDRVARTGLERPDRAGDLAPAAQPSAAAAACRACSGS